MSTNSGRSFVYAYVFVYLFISYYYDYYSRRDMIYLLTFSKLHDIIHSRLCICWYLVYWI